MARLPKLDPCRIHVDRLKALSSDQLMKIWGRLGASRPSRTRVNGLLKGIVSNLAAAKVSAQVHKDPAQRRQAVAAYRHITRQLAAELAKEQARSCSIRSATAAGDWKTVVRLRKR